MPEGYHAVTLLDIENPLSPAMLEHAGVDYLYAPAPTVEIGDDEVPVITRKEREPWETALDLYADTGTRVLLMGGFYIDPPEEFRAVDFFGRKHAMACFRHPDFAREMTERIVTIARAFAQYPAFAGFAFDDGPHVRVDCCYCESCVAEFKARHGVAPPRFEPRGSSRIVEADDPVLLWEEFQQQSWQTYLRTQAQAVRSVSDDLLMVTIPSDSFFYGRFLNVNVKPEETPSGHRGRLQRIERIQPRRWSIWQSFPLARLPEEDEEGLQPWITGAHITADSPKMLMQTEGPYAASYERVRYMSAAEIERMARSTLTEGAAGICYWTPAGPLPSYPDAFDAMAEVYRDIDRIREALRNRTPLPCEIALLYSTTTETMQQPWRQSTSERWRHLHAFEGIAYALNRSNIPFEIVLESDISQTRLRDFRAVVMPAVEFLCEPAASAIEAAIARTGLRALAAGACVPLTGMIETDYDPFVWHRWAARGYRQETHADEQVQELRRSLAERLLPLIDAPVRIYSDRAISRLYRYRDDELLLMVASWDLHEISEVAIEGEGLATDLLSGRVLGRINDLRRLTLPPAGWRVLKVSR